MTLGGHLELGIKWIETTFKEKAMSKDKKTEKRVCRFCGEKPPRKGVPGARRQPEGCADCLRERRLATYRRASKKYHESVKELGGRKPSKRKSRAKPKTAKKAPAKNGKSAKKSKAKSKRAAKPQPSPDFAGPSASGLGAGKTEAAA
jgi:hypothetical protein